MNSQFILLYLLKTITVSGIFYGYYYVALRNNKFHYYNRFYLLASLSLSLIIPLLNFNWFTVEQPVLYGSSQVFNLIIESGKEATSIQLNWMDWSLIVVGIIGAILLIILVVNIFKIYQLKQKSEVKKFNGFDFMNTEEEAAPFSFLNNMFWKNTISLNDAGGQQIFKHEITHIQQKHTWDRLYCQIVSSILWMNPFNWLIQKELQTIHEFIADEQAVGNSNVEAFAQMLLQTHYGNHFLNPAHSFFISSIKRRLIMLTTSRNTKYSYVRRVMVLPLLVLSVGIFSVKVNATERIATKVDALKAAVSQVISDTTKAVNTVELENVGDTIRIKTDSIQFYAGEKNIEGLNTNKDMDQALVIVDGEIVSLEKMKQMDANTIKSVNIIKGDQTKSYGSAASKGVILITTKFGPPPSAPSNSPTSAVDGITEVGTKGAIVNKNGKEPLYLIDGVPVKEGSANPIKYINPIDIESINVLKNKSVTALYGSAGENGVIFVVTKNGNKKSALNAEKVALISQNAMKDKNDFSAETVLGYQKNDPTNNAAGAAAGSVTSNSIQPAHFPGGTDAWIKYLNRNLDRDLPVKRGAPAGRYIVQLSFLVDDNGAISNIKAKTNPGYGTAEEAIRIIKNGPNWIPAERNGEKVMYLTKQSISFAVATE